MRTQFYTNGQGLHRVTLEPENEVEKVMVQAMKLYPCKISATKLNNGPIGDVDALEITFLEADR